ncbi:TPA: hypothetical protein DDW35_13420 [Candidatus Sumerlaeota bacterium]|nr:hypothetical protein [Candidatus Sumerlaeota bacterium]
MKPAASCLGLLLLLLATATPAQTPKPTSVPSSATTPAAATRVFMPEDYEKLVCYAHTLYLMGLNNLATPLFAQADEQIKTMQHSAIRVHMAAEVTLYYAKTNQNLPRMRELATGLRAWLQKLDATQKPLRILCQIAIAHAALVDTVATPNAKTNARADINVAIQDLQSLNAPDLELRALQTLGAISLRDTTTPGEAINTFQNALHRLNNAKGLELAVFCQQLVEYQTLAQNQTGAELARQNVRQACANFWDGPLPDMAQILSQATAIMEDHPRTADAGYWQRALNEVISLLALKHAGGEEVRRQFRPSELALLANASYYAYQHDDALPALFFYQTALAQLPNETELLPRAEASRLLCRCQRVMGNFSDALTTINAAEKILKDYTPQPKVLLTAILEEKALVLAAQGQRAEAAAQLSAVQKDSPADAAPRLEFYQWVLATPSLNPSDVFSQPRAFSMAQRTWLREKKPQVAPPSSLLANEATGTTKRSAADALLQLNLDRPNAPTTAVLDPQIYMKTQRWDKAVDVLLQMQQQKETAENWALIGECYCNLAQWAKAQDALERTLKMNPANNRAAEYLKTAKSRLQK